MNHSFSSLLDRFSRLIGNRGSFRYLKILCEVVRIGGVEHGVKIADQMRDVPLRVRDVRANAVANSIGKLRTAPPY